MKRAKRSRRTTARRPARRAPTTPTTAAKPTKPTKPTRPSPAETALLALARALSELTEPEAAPGPAVTAALDELALAFRAGAPLPRALAQARNAALTDEARALAVAWAREQLRLSLGEILGRAIATGDVKVALPAESLAWLVLAACEALADEPPHAAPDRVRLLAEWLQGARADD
jgi:hypothetical protein